jgi:hypothetical protein
METVGKSQPDHRLRYMEYGKGVEFSGDGLSAGWEVGSEAARFVNGPGPAPNGYQDLLSAEVYWYTDADVNNFSQGGVYFNNGTANITLDQRRRASNYGLLVDNLRAYDAKDGQRQAVLGFVELGQTGSESDRAIQPAEVKAAVWHSMIAGARGIIYFPFSFAGPCVQLRIMADTTGCYTAVQAAVKQVDAQLQRLAPVLNDDFADGYVTVAAPCTACPNSVKAHTTQGVRAMAKFHDGHYYVFAGNNDNESKQATFTLAGVLTARRRWLTRTGRSRSRAASSRIRSRRGPPSTFTGLIREREGPGGRPELGRRFCGHDPACGDGRVGHDREHDHRRVLLGPVYGRGHQLGR